MRDRNVDLVAAVVIAALAAVAASLPLPGTVLLVFGLGLLVATGYVVGEAVLGPVERSLEGLALTVVLVLGLPAIGGVVFHAEGVPLHRGAWVTLFVVVTAIAAAVAGRRRETATTPLPNTVDEGMPDADEVSDVPATPRRRSSPVLLGAAGVVVATAIWLAVSGANAQQYTGYTELSMVSHADQAVLGVRNFEGHRQHYLVLVWRNYSVPLRFRLDLPPGATWTHVIPRPNGAGLIADLFLGTPSDKPYRRVFLARTQDVSLR